MSRIGELQLDIDKTAGNVVQLLVSKGKKIACAESCTGGLISAAITSVSGSSARRGAGIYAQQVFQHKPRHSARQAKNTLAASPLGFLPRAWLMKTNSLSGNSSFSWI